MARRDRGAGAQCTSITLQAPPGRSGDWSALFRIAAAQEITIDIVLALIDPSGRESVTRNATVSLLPGMHDLAIPLPFTADRAGTWSLRYDIASRLPEGPGFTSDTMPVFSGRLIMDAGASTVLAVGSSQPAYYEPRGPLTVTGTFFGAAGSKAELLIDGKRVKREKLSTTGSLSLTFASDVHSLFLPVPALQSRDGLVFVEEFNLINF